VYARGDLALGNSVQQSDITKADGSTVCQVHIDLV